MRIAVYTRIATCINAFGLLEIWFIITECDIWGSVVEYWRPTSQLRNAGVCHSGRRSSAAHNRNREVAASPEAVGRHSAGFADFC